jgi:hypothetical protein
MPTPATSTPATSTVAAPTVAMPTAAAQHADHTPDARLRVPDLFDGDGMHHWLVRRRNAGATPDTIARELVANGWDADRAARTSLRSLRSADRQTLTYAALTVAAGLGALGTASSLHLVLDGNPDPELLAWTLCVALVALPIAATIGYLASRIEARSRYVMWSASRRGWFGALALSAATVGIVRLLTYLYQAMTALTGASSSDSAGTDAAQVGVSLVIAVPLFTWSFLEWRRSNLVISALGEDEELDQSGARRT